MFSRIFIGISTRAIYWKSYEALINEISVLFSNVSFNNHGLQQILLKFSKQSALSKTKNMDVL